jgi:hypothetical protein
MHATQAPSREHGLHLVRDFDLPPVGFNALKASEDELQSYGLPRRPDRERHPDQAALWDRFAARSLRFVRPSLTPLTERARPELRDHDVSVLDGRLDESILLRLHSRGLRPCQVLPPQRSTNWSGAVVKRPASEQLVTVTGQWVVPSVSPPASAWNGRGYNDGRYVCAVWVGLDGWYGTEDVLQAGTTSELTVTGGKVTSTTYYPWIEWFGNLWKPEPFAVNPGDAILCNVCAPFGNEHGTAIFVNQTTGFAVPYGIDPPDKTKLSGNVAEWIVEDPELNKILFPFPNYGLVTFQHCGAGSKNVSLNLGDACPLDLEDGSGKVISEGAINSNTSLTCDFVG